MKESNRLLEGVDFSCCCAGGVNKSLSRVISMAGASQKDVEPGEFRQTTLIKFGDQYYLNED